MAPLNNIAAFPNRPAVRLSLAAGPPDVHGQSPPTDPAAYAAALLDFISFSSQDAGRPTSDVAGAAGLINGAQHTHISTPPRAAKITRAAGVTASTPSTVAAREVDAAGTASSSAGSALQGALLVLDDLQRTVGEGPALDVFGGGRQMLVQDLHVDDRWPQLTARAPWQIRSMLCTPLHIGSKVRCLSAVSAQAWAFDETSARQASVVAAHLGVGLTHAEHVRNVTAMACSRDVIGQAKGILMQLYHCTAVQAFDLLSKVSQHTNTTVLSLSEHLTRTGELPALTDTGQTS